MNSLLNLDPAAETQKITAFIKTVLQKQNFRNILIGMSGGIDSTTSFTLLRESIALENIFVAHLHYFKSQIDSLKPILQQANIPQKNISSISIKSSVDSLKMSIGLTENSQDYKIRLGNIMARVRMTILYDLAKKHQALVCGTENKSEYRLGYFTRFGDEAADFEPIRHLYKTQVYTLAKHLKVSKNIIDQVPTAGLWEGQTDEGDFGFSYAEADSVLRLYFEKNHTLPQIISQGFPNAKAIIERVNQNSFKHCLPYKIK